MVSKRKKNITFSRLLDKFQDRFDYFGQQVKFTYKGKDHFTTRPGFLVSVIFGSIILTVVIIETIKFFNQTQAFQLINKTPFLNQTLDLVESNFMFAINTVDETIGNIDVQFVKWPAQGDKIKTKIEMIKCEDVIIDQTDQAATDDRTISNNGIE